MEENNKKYYISLVSGELYSLTEDEGDNLDQFQVPLTGIPNKSCRYCYGRGFIGKNIHHNLYILCRCLKNKIDFKKISSYQQKIQEENSVKIED